jgi:alcohol dehydrogenase class IV
MDAMRARAPAAIESLARALEADPARIRERIEALGGGPRRLGDLAAERGRLRRALDAILSRPELQNTPEPPGREELEHLLESAW